MTGPSPAERPEPEGTVPAWLRQRSRHGRVDEIPLPRSGGRLWLCGKHLVGPDPEGLLAALGADRIVCLCEEHELADRFPGYVAWLHAERDSSAIWFPIPDLHAPDAARTAELLDRLRAALDRGETLVLHCGAGIGRAGTIAAALLIDLGVPHDDAVDTVGRHRPLAGPEAGAQADLLRSMSAGAGRPGDRGADRA